MPNNNPASKVGMYIPDVKGSYFNRSFKQSLTLAPGKYTPARCIEVPGNSHVSMQLASRIETLPAVSPLYDGWRLVTKVHYYPYRLGMPKLRKNERLNAGAFDDEFLPLCTLRYELFSDSKLREFGINTSASADNGGLFERLGLQPFELLDGLSYVHRDRPKINVENLSDTVVTQSFVFNFGPFLAYFHSWLWSEWNKQDDNIPVDQVTYYYTGDGLQVDALKNQTRFFDAKDLERFVNCFGFGNSYSYGNVSVENGQMFVNALDKSELSLRFVENYPWFSNNVARQTPITDDLDTPLEPWSYTALNVNWNTMRNRVNSVGLLPVTYQGDKFTSWFNEESIEHLRTYVVSNGMTFEQLRLRHSNYLIAALEMISGDRYVDMLRFVYDEYLELKDHPILVGRDVLSFGFINVLNQSANTDTMDSNSSANVNQSLAYTASKGHEQGKKCKPIHFKAKEPGLLLITHALVPSVTYYQGIDRMFYKQRFGDLWHSQFSSAGFQSVYRGEIYSALGLPYDVGSSTEGGYVFGAFNDDRFSLSFVPFGWEYMTTENRISGALRTDAFRTWTLSRDFSAMTNGYGVSSDDMDALNCPPIELLRSTYVDRSMFDINFVDNSPEAQNFIVKTEVDLNVYQPMSKQLLNNRL